MFLKKAISKVVGTVAKGLALVASCIASKTHNLNLSSKLLNKSLMNNGSPNAKKKLDKKTNALLEEKTKSSKEIKKSNGKPICYASSTTFNSTKDLQAAINKAKYDISVAKIQDTNKWKIDVKISDIYDFELEKEEYVNDFLLTTVNNGAYLYQELGLLVPYEWDVSYSFIYEE